MGRVQVVGALMCVVALGCDGGGKGHDADAGPPDAGPPTGPIVPAIGTAETIPVDCTGAYELPVELTGDEGLGHHDWELDDLLFNLAWSNANRFRTNWISGSSLSEESLRMHPWLVPQAGYCYRDGLREATAQDGGLLGAVLSWISAFGHPTSTFDALERDYYESPAYDFAGADLLARAVQGLYETPNELPGAPEVDPWDDSHAAAVAAVADGLSPDAEEALARLVLALGEAYLLKQQLLADGDAEMFESIFDGFLDAYYSSDSNARVSPAGPVHTDIFDYGAYFDLTLAYQAALAVAVAADEFRAAAEQGGPFASPGLDLLTPHGRLLIATADEPTDYDAEQLADAVLVIDLGGDDSYGGRYAATHQFWMSASVLIDLAGADRYNPELADIEDAATTTAEAFDVDGGFTQGSGLFGVGLLIDGAGDDEYAAAVYGQGNAAFGVGILQDRGGVDSYKVGHSGQGAGFFGIGLLIDEGGGDHYGVYTLGQGAGRPWGQGLLFDLGGDDEYIGYYAGGMEGLPGDGYNNYYQLADGTPYAATDGTPHYMSIAQGTGWGYRGDWSSSGTNWMGGFGALVDFGDGADTHYSDCMSMGQGFVYGFGFLYDDGGDDIYHTFWWGPAAAAHMGVGLMIEEDGNDEILVTRASGGFGYDCSVGWLIDAGGNDTYGGQFHYGRAYLYALTFMINDGGDDEYNAGGVLGDPSFGYVHSGFSGVKLLGAFLDLGGGNDTYNTSVEGIGNDAYWYLDPLGDDVDPAIHKGIGIDK